MTTKTIYLDLYNPFSDLKEAVLGEFDCHSNGKEIDHIEAVSIMTQSQVEMVNYLSEEEKEKLTDYVMEKFGGEI